LALSKRGCKSPMPLRVHPRRIPAHVVQADALAKALDELGKRLDAVISIDVDKRALVERLTARRACRSCGAIYNVMSQPQTASGVCPACGGELYQRDDDTVATVTNRLKVYEESTAPLIAYYRDKGILHEVDGNRPVDAVFASIRSVLEGSAR